MTSECWLGSNLFYNPGWRVPDHTRSKTVLGKDLAMWNASRFTRPFWLSVPVGLFLSVIVMGADDSGEVRGVRFFEEKIRPVLVTRCYGCHSEKARSTNRLKGKLFLDTREGIRAGGESGPAVVPGKPGDSLLIGALRYESFKMPPKKQLAAGVIADFVTWIRMGAPDPRNGKSNSGRSQDLASARSRWAFRRVERPPVPRNHKHPEWPRTDLDRLVLSVVEAQGLEPSADAGRRALIRRATYDLIGLPPTGNEVEQFLADREPGAFGRVVNRLLDSVDFGVRWGRHWLDNVRYSLDDPTCAANKNENFSIGAYRDWVVKSFNRDLPYDEFVRQQVAGDLLPVDRPGALNSDGLTATGIWALAHLVEGNDKEKVLADCIDEQLDVLGRTFLGLTVSCARCHDHKFDPISQQDYYALAGIFYSSHMFTFQGSARLRRRLQQPLVSDESAAHGLRMRKSVLDGLESTIKSLDKKLGKTRQLFQVQKELVSLRKKMASEPDEKRKMELSKAIKAAQAKERELLADQKKNGWTVDAQELEHRDRLAAERDRLSPLVSRVVSRMVMRDGPVPGTRHKRVGDARLFIRGDHLSPGAVVARGFPRVFAEADRPAPRINGSGRLELARWLTRPDHPLTARVMVNRVWQHLVGVGIVETPSNFGRLGRPPTHPQVLDWLAVKFIKSGWSIKSLVRLIMTSSVYRQTSLSSLDGRRRDPRNRWLSRMNRKRLDAESLKDTLLWHAGQVSRASVETWQSSKRSLFSAPTRSAPDPFLSLFDGPDPHLVIPRRVDSTSAPQSLFMMNNPLVQSTARSIVSRLLKTGENDEVMVEALYQRLVGRPPTANEQRLASQTLDEARQLRRRLTEAGQKTAGGRDGAWEDLCMVLLCGNEFIYID